MLLMLLLLLMCPHTSWNILLHRDPPQAFPCHDEIFFNAVAELSTMSAMAESGQHNSALATFYLGDVSEPVSRVTGLPAEKVEKQLATLFCCQLHADQHSRDSLEQCLVEKSPSTLIAYPGLCRCDETPGQKQRLRLQLAQPATSQGFRASRQLEQTAQSARFSFQRCPSPRSSLPLRGPLQCL